MALRELVLELGIDVDRGDYDQATGALDKLRDAAVRVGTLLTTGALAIGYKKLVELGSEAAEAQNKFVSVFTDASDTVQASLEDTARRTGIATSELKVFASSIGALVRPSLGSAEAAGQVGATMAELALDIASFNDVRPDEALVALRSGLIGSAEPLQRFGVDVRVAALEQEALRLGYTKTYKDLSEGERILIRQSAIIRQLGAGGALGDATKTAKGYANASRALSSQIKDLGQTIGKFLLKDAAETVLHLSAVVSRITAWIRANEELIQQGVDDFFQVINNTIEGAVMVIGYVVDRFRDLADVLGPTTTALIGVTTVIGILVAILGAPIVLFFALSAAIALVADDLVTFAKGGESVFGSLIENVKEFISQFVDLQTIEDFADQFVTIVGGIWDDIVLYWKESIAPFFDQTLEGTSDLIGTLLEKSKELFADFEGNLAKFFNNFFNSAIGRVILDFLGVKAGAVIGEFVGSMAGKLAGQFVGKGKVGRLISTFLGEKLGGVVGKLAGGVAGGVLADQAVLGMRSRLNAPASVSPSIGPIGGGGGGSSLSQNTEMKISVDATGQSNPQAIADMTAKAVDDALERHYRLTAQSFGAASP